MGKTNEKTWWLQTKDEPDKLERVRLISRSNGWVCVKTAGPVNGARGPYIAAYALKVREFDRTWRTWKIMPTMNMMQSAWTGRRPRT